LAENIPPAQSSLDKKVKTLGEGGILRQVPAPPALRIIANGRSKGLGGGGIKKKEFSPKTTERREERGGISGENV